MSDPKVSIAVPAYNVEKYVAQALESLLAQTYGDFELVISDNASTDGTEDICRSYAARDSRIRYVRRTENCGGPGNFRYVFSLCRGRYHKWSTADDYWDPRFLEKTVPVLDAQPDVVLCYPKTVLIDFAGNRIEDYQDNLHLQERSPRARFVRLLRDIGLCNAHLGLIRRDAMSRTALITGEHKSDYHFLAELALYGTFYLLDEPLFFRRYHQQSSSWARDDMEHQRRYYDPTGRAYFGMHTWRKYRRLSGAVLRSPIALSEKAGLMADLAKMMSWERTSLTRELQAYFRRAPSQGSPA